MWYIFSKYVSLWFLVPVACTTGGDECAANADGLTSCPADGGNCIGKLIHNFKPI